MRILESTDGKYLGSEVVFDAGTLLFEDGRVMFVEVIVHDADGTTVLANSNYQIRVKE